MRACGSVSLRVPSETSAVPPDLPTAFFAGDLADLFELAPGDLNAALALPRPSERSRLVDALTSHARRLGAPAEALQNIARLADPAARAVVTGQQTGLLLGPTYTLSKAVTALRLAASLDREDRPVVPVFWLASQDHDSDEIDHSYLLDGSETLRRVAVELPEGVPAGRVPFSAAMLDSVLASFSEHSPRAPFAAEVGGLLQGFFLGEAQQEFLPIATHQVLGPLVVDGAHRQFIEEDDAVADVLLQLGVEGELGHVLP